MPKLVTEVDALIRKGQSGQGKGSFTEEQIQFIRKKIDTHATPVGLKFRGM